MRNLSPAGGSRSRALPRILSCRTRRKPSAVILRGVNPEESPAKCYGLAVQCHSERSVSGVKNLIPSALSF